MQVLTFTAGYKTSDTLLTVLLGVVTKSTSIIRQGRARKRKSRRRKREYAQRDWEKS